MERLKAAVIGMGRMGAEPSERLEGKAPHGWLPISHVESILAIPSLELVGLCDNDTTRLTKLSKLYNVSNTYTDYTKLIDELKPQFLSIATRTKGRTDIIKYACENGVKILYFEKPICNSIAEGRQALAVASERNVVVGYGVNRRYHTAYRKAREILRSGELGKIEHICVEHNSTNLLWAHPHSVDIILFFIESCELEYVQGNCTYIDDYKPSNYMLIDNDPIVNHAFFKFKNGITASISPTRGLNTRITCEKGILTVYSDGTWLEINDINKTGYINNGRIINIDISLSATVNAFSELIEISSGNSIIEKPITNEEIIAGLIMLNGLAFSALNGGVMIKAEDVPEDMVVTGKMGSWYA